MNKLRCINDKQRVFARGLCRKCYNHSQIRVRKGEWTWEGQEAKGLALPQTKRGPKPPEWAKVKAAIVAMVLAVLLLAAVCPWHPASTTYPTGGHTVVRGQYLNEYHCNAGNHNFWAP